MDKILKNITLTMTTIIFIVILLFSFFYDSNVFYHDNPFLSVIFSIITMFIWLIICMFVDKKIKNITRKNGVIFLIIYFIVVSIIQYIVLKKLSVTPGWDFGVVFSNAEFYALNGGKSVPYPEYLQLFPNNIMLFVLYVIFIKFGFIFNIKPLFSVYILNVLFIDLSLLILYLTIKKMKDRKSAVFGLILSFSFLPLFLYTPIIYSDTLSLFIPILFVYLYLNIDKEKVLTKKNIILFALVGILLFFGKEIKITSLIIFIAIIIDYLTKNFKIKKFILVIISFTIFFVCELSFKVFIVNSNAFQFKVNDSKSIPISHWIMMGVEDIDKDNSGRNSYGGYNASDYNETTKYSTNEEKVKYNINEFSSRVKKMGFIGYSNYLVHKAVNTWTDGYYFSNVALSINPRHKNSKLYRLLLENESTTKMFRALTQGVQYALIIIIISGCIFKIKKKDNEQYYIQLTIVGLVIFFLLWENRSRYIFNYIPIFILIIVEFYNNFKEKLWNKKSFKV